MKSLFGLLSVVLVCIGSTTSNSTSRLRDFDRNLERPDTYATAISIVTRDRCFASPRSRATLASISPTGRPLSCFNHSRDVTFWVAFATEVPPSPSPGILYLNQSCNIPTRIASTAEVPSTIQHNSSTTSTATTNCTKDHKVVLDAWMPILERIVTSIIRGTVILLSLLNLHINLGIQGESEINTWANMTFSDSAPKICTSIVEVIRSGIDGQIRCEVVRSKHGVLCE